MKKNYRNQSGNLRSLVSKDHTYLLENTDKIMYLRGDENYSTIFLRDEINKTICKCVKECQEILGEEKFLRCHKQYLVSIDFIEDKNIYGKSVLTLKNNQYIPISRRKKPLVNKILKGKGIN